MKKITLLELNLINLFGITARYAMKPGRNVFSGANGLGKTRLANTESWIRTGKNLEGTTKNEVKSLKGGEIETKGFHAAFAKYDIGGKEICIGRSLQEKWTKKRGELEETRTGNDIKYYTGAMSVDDPETQKLTAKKFQELIDSEFGGDYAKASTINYLSSLHWKELRKFLTVVCPVDQSEIIKKTGLAEYLDGKTPEERKAIADDRKKVLKTKFDANQSAIAERKKDLESAGKMSIEDAERNVEHERQEIGKVQAKISQLKQGDNLEKIQELNLELSEAVQEFETRKMEAKNAEFLRQQNIKGIEQDIKLSKEALARETEAIEKLRSNAHKIIAEKKALRAKTVDELSEVCEACGQVLPDDVLNKLRQDFMENRAQDLTAKQSELDKNNAEGLTRKAEIEKLEQSIADSEKRLAELGKIDPDPILNQTADQQIEIDNIKIEISTLQHSEVDSPELKRLEAELEALNVRLSNAQEQKAAVKASAESKKRLEELQAERKKLSAENDKIQYFLVAYDEYMNAYADAVQGPVNELIQGVKFRMFEMSEMNKRVEACEVCNQDWKRYNTMCSTGEQIGVDLACTAYMQRYTGILAPIWIDERQSYTGKIPLDCQYFELVTREDVLTLTKEV